MADMKRAVKKGKKMVKRAAKSDMGKKLISEQKKVAARMLRETAKKLKKDAPKKKRK